MKRDLKVVRFDKEIECSKNSREMPFDQNRHFGNPWIRERSLYFTHLYSFAYLFYCCLSPESFTFIRLIS